MSITKTIFTSTTIADSLTEIAAWLTANSSVVGMTVSTDTDGAVVCTSANGTNFLKFCANNADRVGVTITLGNGVTRAEQAGNGYPDVWKTGYSCTNGLALYAGTSSAHYWVFISKTENGGLCVVEHSNSSSIITTYLADISSGVAITKSSANATLGNTLYLTDAEASPKTTFAPICFDSGVTAGAMYFTPQTQYVMPSAQKALDMVITSGGDEYVYSGLIAMRGGQA